MVLMSPVPLAVVAVAAGRWRVEVGVMMSTAARPVRNAPGSTTTACCAPDHNSSLSSTGGGWWLWL